MTARAPARLPQWMRQAEGFSTGFSDERHKDAHETSITPF